MIQTYVYKSPGDNLFWLTASTLSCLFAVYLITKLVAAETFNWLTLLLPIIFGLLGIVLLKMYLLRRQYQQVDENKVITVDTSKKEIVINQSGRETIISNSNIETVEIYSSWNTNPIFANLGYLKINFSNGDNVKVTRFTASDIDLQPLITGKSITRQTRLMNSIK